MSSKPPIHQSFDLPPDCCVAIVAARFNSEIVDELLDGCLRRLAEMEISGTQVEIFRAPGAFELPVLAKRLAQTKRFKAVICLGCLIRGETPHFDFIAAEAARGIQQVALEYTLPVIFGVLTCENEKQARDRTGGAHGHMGERAADTAAEMIAAMSKIRS